MGVFKAIETLLTFQGAYELKKKLQGKDSKPKIDDFAPRNRGIDSFARGKKHDPLL